MHKSAEEAGSRMAQKCNGERVLRLVERRLHQMKHLAEEYQDNELDKIFQKEHIARQSLIVPVANTKSMRLYLYTIEKNARNI